MCQGPVASGSRASEGLKDASVAGVSAESQDSVDKMRQARWVRHRAFQASIKSFDHAVGRTGSHEAGSCGGRCWMVETRLALGFMLWLQSGEKIQMGLEQTWGRPHGGTITAEDTREIQEMW